MKILFYFNANDRGQTDKKWWIFVKWVQIINFADKNTYCKLRGLSVLQNSCKHSTSFVCRHQSEMLKRKEIWFMCWWINVNALHKDLGHNLFLWTERIWPRVLRLILQIWHRNTKRQKKINCMKKVY